MADGLHTRLKRGSWTRGIGLSTAGGYDARAADAAFPRRAPTFTQADVARAIRAAKPAGAESVKATASTASQRGMCAAAMGR